MFVPDCTRPVGVVSGEPGIGKSRVVDELLRSPAIDAIVVRRGGCHLADQVLPFGPFIDMASRGNGLDLLADALTAADDDTGDERSELRRRRSFDQIAQAILDANHPTLVVIEDVHWADDVSLLAIGHLARAFAGTHHRMLLTHRPHERTPAYARVLAEMARLRVVDEVELRPLDADQVGEMAEAMAGVALTAEQRRTLIEVSDGNPFYVEELLRSTNGDLDPADVAVPRPVEYHVVARLADLAPLTREAVCRAAVVGRDVPVDQLAGLMGWDARETARHATALVAAGLLKDVDGDRLRFVHELARRAVESQLLSIERVDIHRRIADALTAGIGDQQQPAAIDERTRADLARHAYEGQDWPAAIEHGTVAARAALGRWSAAAAITHLDRVIDAATRSGREPSAEVRLLRGRARLHVGDIEGAGDDLRAAAHQAEANGDPAAAWRANFELAMLAGQRSHEDAVTSLDKAMSAAERWGEPIAIARTLNRQGNLATNRFDMDAAIRLFERAMQLASEAGDDTIVAETGVLSMVNHSLSGDLRSARRDGASAVERLRGLDDPIGLISALFSLSMTGGEHSSELSRPSASLDQCAAEAEEALERSISLGWTTGEAFSRRGLGGVRSAQGRAAEAVELMRTSIRVAETTGHVPQILRGHAVMGEVLLDIGDLTGSRRHIEQAIELGGRLGAAAALLPSRIRLAEVDIADGRLDDAEERLARIVADGAHAERSSLGARAQLLLARGEAEAALELVEGAVSVLPEGADGDPPARLDHLAAEALAQLRRLDEATEALIRADRQTRRHGMRLLLRHVLATRATVCARQGDREAARRWCDEAWAMANEAAEGLEPDLTAALRADMERRTAAVPRTEGTGASGPAVLTRREREVAEVLARGLTNQQVADELFISVRTAETHVKHILAKLGFRSRAQIARWVTDQHTG
jgi:DNA-binding NarL/FixJ family response regulator